MFRDKFEMPRNTAVDDNIRALDFAQVRQPNLTLHI